MFATKAGNTPLYITNVTVGCHFEVQMVDVRIERGTCRFVAGKRDGGRATITLQFSQKSVSLLNHATLSFNLLSGLTLEQAQKIAETLTENVLDASVEMSSAHPLFVGVERR